MRGRRGSEVEGDWTLRHRSDPNGLALAHGDLEFLQSLGGPTAITIRGADPTRCRAVVTLLHGNEPSGQRALRRWLGEGVTPATDLLVIFGNVAAGRIGERLLPGGRDMNRCFLPPYEGAEASVAKQILEAIAARPLEALLDLHNNTGHNPAYGVGVDDRAERVGLVSLFGRKFVYSDLHLGSLMEALPPELPAVTIECGRAGDPGADEIAFQGLRRFVDADDLIGATRNRAANIEILERPARVCLRSGAGIAFAERRRPGAGLTMALDIDRHNFQCIPAGEVVGWLDPDLPWPLFTVDARGDDLSRNWFGLDGDFLRTRVDMVPIMMTTDPQIARQDCLFYVVHPRPRRGDAPDTDSRI